VALLSETSFQAIIIIPAYRLNVYGFLASHELLNDPSNRSGTVGNLGFWDQRLALQWTYTNISYFSGNPSNITVAGYSAGAHSVFYQLAHDIDYPPDRRIIKRVIMHANGPGLQPKTLAEHQEQFDELLDVLKISKSLPVEQKLRLLRDTSSAALRKAIDKMKLHEFRGLDDGHFIKTTLFQELEDGTFAKKLIESKVQILVGESANEHFMYAKHRAPGNSPEAVYQRLLADYPRWAVNVLKETYFKGNTLPAGVKSWKELFGHIYADVQVHVSERGFVDALCRHGAKHLVHRYCIEFRSDVTWAPKMWGPTHWADNVIWFFGDGKVLPPKEKQLVLDAFTGEYAKYVRGDTLDWGSSSPYEVRRLRSDGRMDVWRDELWEEKLKIWHSLQSASAKRINRDSKPNL
jgi:carboxylesterase type B